MADFPVSGTLTGPTPDIPPGRRAAAAFIFVTILLDFMAMGVIIPVLPRLIQTLGGGSAGQVAKTFGVFAAIFALLQFLAQPIQGALSDRFGRRPIILASNFGLGFDYLLMALAPNLGWLLLGRIIAGAAAGSLPAASAYMADVSGGEDRAGGFGRIWAAASAGIVLGPLLGGALSGLDLRAPFWAAAALSLANGLYGLFVLPESLRAEHRSAVKLDQLNPIGALAHLSRRYPGLLGMMLVSFLSGLTWQGVNPLFVVYTIFRYHWSPLDISLLLAVLGGCNCVLQIWLTPLAVRWAGERRVALFGIAAQVAALLTYGLARNSLEFWLGVPLLCAGNLAGPAWQALISNRVGPAEQGRLSGALSGLFAVAGVVSPIALTSLFAAVTSAKVPAIWLGAPFFVACATSGLALGLAALTSRGKG
ncbi:MAG: MFS transporter [Alphaproteobacteria bacterium]|nr:MFS transporter [Alphaproteobacteria bacterium]